MRMEWVSTREVIMVCVSEELGECLMFIKSSRQKGGPSHTPWLSTCASQGLVVSKVYICYG